MALGSTQPIVKMSTRNISWGVKVSNAWGWQPHHIHVLNVMDIWEPKPPGILWVTLGLLWDCFTFMYAVPNMAPYFLYVMLARHVVHIFSEWFLVAHIITGNICFYFSFHIHCTSILRTFILKSIWLLFNFWKYNIYKQTCSLFIITDYDGCFIVRYGSVSLHLFIPEHDYLTLTTWFYYSQYMLIPLLTVQSYTYFLAYVKVQLRTHCIMSLYQLIWRVLSYCCHSLYLLFSFQSSSSSAFILIFLLTLTHSTCITYGPVSSVG
jgi:hypothetical protein